MASLRPSKFKRLYPRFCGSFTFPEVDMDAIPLRSEIWLMKLIEDAYDEALADARKNNVAVRAVHKTVLDLGSLDNFPSVVKRLLQNRYSVLEVMQAMVCEFLCTLHAVMERESKVLHSHLPPTNSQPAAAENDTNIHTVSDMDYVTNAKRATLFAKFLSEEYDLSFVALYLHTREAIQNHFNIKLTHFVTPKIWTDFVEEDLELVAQSFSSKHPPKPKPHQAIPNKATPHKLPKFMSFTPDSALPEVSLPCLHTSALAVLLSNVFIGFTTDNKLYLTDKLLETVAKHTYTVLNQFNEYPVPVYFNLMQKQKAEAQAQAQAQSQKQLIASGATLAGENLNMDSSRPGTAEDGVVLLDLQTLQTVDGSDLMDMEGGVPSPTEHAEQLSPSSNKQRQRRPPLTRGDTFATTHSSLKQQCNNYMQCATVDELVTYNNPCGLTAIPIALLLYVLTEEWKKVPTDAKDKFIGRDTATEQLRVLNVIYDKDSLMMKELAEQIRVAQMDLSLCVSQLTKLEKNKRKLERKWAEEEGGNADVEELEELTRLRVQVVEAQVTKVGFEEKVNSLMKQERTLKEKVHSLWTSLTDPGANSVTAAAVAAKENKAADKKLAKKKSSASHAQMTAAGDDTQMPSDGKGGNIYTQMAPTGTPLEPLLQWRIDILKQFSAALAYNEEDTWIRLGIPKPDRSALKEAVGHPLTQTQTQSQQSLTRTQILKQQRAEAEVQAAIEAAEKIARQKRAAEKQREKEKERIKLLKTVSQSMTDLLVPPGVEKAQQQSSVKKKKELPPRHKKTTVTATTPTVSHVHLSDQLQKSTAVVALLDDLAQQMAHDAADALRYTHHHLMAKQLIENITHRAVTDLTEAIQLKRIAESILLAPQVPPPGSQRSTLTDSQKYRHLLDTDHHLQDVRRHLEDDEALAQQAQQHIQEVSDQLSDAQQQQLEADAKLQALTQRESDEEALFKLIFEEAQRLENLTHTEVDELAHKQQQLVELQDQLETQLPKELEETEEILDELAAKLEDIHEETQAKHVAVETAAEELADIEALIESKAEEVRRLSTIMQSDDLLDDFYFTGAKEVEGLRERTLSETEELQREHDRAQEAVKRAQEEEARAAEAEAEMLRLQQEELERVEALRRQESETRRQLAAIAEEAKALALEEAENERKLAEAKAEAERILALEREIEEQRLAAEQEAAEALHRAQELEKERLAAEAEAELLAQKRAAEAEEARQLELQEAAEAAELKEWDARIDMLATTVCVFVTDYICDDLFDSHIGSLLMPSQDDDRWFACLEMKEELFVSADTLSLVNQHALNCKTREANRYLRACMRTFHQYVAYKRLSVKYEHGLTVDHFAVWRRTQLRTQLRLRSCCKIQSLARKYIRRKENARIRAAALKARAHYRQRTLIDKHQRNMLRWWFYLAHTQRVGANTVIALRERRFIKTFYTWLHTYKMHKRDRLKTFAIRSEACLRIQTLARVYISRKVLVRLQRATRLVIIFRRILAARRVRKRRLYMRRLQEYAIKQSATTLSRITHKCLRRWKTAHRIGKACAIGQHTINVSQSRFVWKTWKANAHAMTVQRHAAATRIQALVRRRIVIVCVFSFYRWRRGLVKAQSLVRRTILARDFAVTLYIFRAARRIQKCFRGSQVRARMTESRIVAMHYAAAHNNYEKLQYFTTKYPEIISELDADGNTALHNAAMNASRRTLKLLLRCNLDPNAYNLSGYTSLHLVIMSNAVSRDDCCLYMLDHGFDEDQLTRTSHSHPPDDGKSSLLLACEYGRIVIVRKLLSNGMNPNTPDHSGATCLQFACSYGYFPIVKLLIDHDAYINAPGYGGTVPLHDVCNAQAAATGTDDRLTSPRAGSSHSPRSALSPRSGGNGGQFSPRGALSRESSQRSALTASGHHDDSHVKIAKLLLDEGAYVNTYEPFYSQSPLMYACTHGLEEIVRLFLLAGADAHARDTAGKTVAHFSAMSNNPKLFFALHEADVDFDGIDDGGDTPLHTATEYNAIKFVEVLLKGLVNPSIQNNNGDQPAHIAARYNHVDILVLLAKYDEHMGRVNLQHQTPLGVAKYYGNKEAQRFLESRFTKLDDEYKRHTDRENHLANSNNAVKLHGTNVRNVEDGHIWWDKEADAAYAEWTMRVTELGDRIFTNRITGEVTRTPPKVSLEAIQAANLHNEVLLRKNVEIVRDGGYALTKHDYLIEHAQEKEKLNHYLLEIKCAVVIGRYMRRKLAYMQIKRMRNWKSQTRILARFMRNNLPRFKARRLVKKNRLIVKPQALYRGYISRKKYYSQPNGLYYQYHHRRFTLYFKRRLWAIWRSYKFEKMSKIAYILRHLPQNSQQWQEVVWRAKKPTRIVGMYEEYLYPGTKHIHFYRHRVKHTCGFEKPKGLLQMDEERRKMYELMRIFGYTPQQYKLAVKLQALWRGYYIRSYFIFIERAMAIYMNAEKKYMLDPNDENNLYNYALYVHAVEQDYVHARSLYSKAIQKMETRGPDIAFILYAYAIFNFVTHDQDYSDICILLDRARAAELYQADVEKRKLHDTTIDDPNKPKVKKADFRFGRIFDLASVGFFRFSAQSESVSDRGLAWHNLGACLFLVSNDFEGSFDAFLQAFRYDPSEKHQKANFDTMMEHFHGSDKDYLVEIVKERMQKLAARDAEMDNARRQKVEDMIRGKAAIQIQRVIRGFIARVRVQNMYVAKMMNIGYEAAARRRRSTIISVNSLAGKSLKSNKSGKSSVSFQASQSSGGTSVSGPGVNANRGGAVVSKGRTTSFILGSKL